MQDESHLDDMQTLNIPLVTGHTITLDGAEHPVSLLGATELASDGTNHGEMSKMFYLRDHIQTARALMELYLQDPERYSKEGELGRHMLFSVMHSAFEVWSLREQVDIAEILQAEYGLSWEERLDKAWQLNPHLKLLTDSIPGFPPDMPQYMRRLLMALSKPTVLTESFLNATAIALSVALKEVILWSIMLHRLFIF